MRKDHKFLVWAAIIIGAVILFIVAAIKEGEVKQKMRPDTYQANRFENNYYQSKS